MDESDIVVYDDISTHTCAVREDDDTLAISTARVADISIDRESTTDYQRFESCIRDGAVYHIPLDIEYTIHHITTRDTSCEECSALDHSTTSCIGDRPLFSYYPAVIEIEFSDIGTCSIPDDTDSFHMSPLDLDRSVCEVGIYICETVDDTSWLCE